MTGRPLAWILSLALAGSEAAGDAMLRVAVPPVRWVMDRASAEERIAICLSSYWRECLEATPGIRLLSENRTRAILSDCRGGSRDFVGDRLLAELNARCPVDVLADYECRTGMVRVTVYTVAGGRHLDVPFSGNGSAVQVAEASSVFLIRELGLSGEVEKTWERKRIEKAPFFDDYYVSQRLNTSWIINAGASRLRMLQPHLTAHPRDSLLAARAFESAQKMLDDRRKTDFLDKGLRIAWIALPVVLGTSHEAAAYPLLRSRPRTFEDDLLTVAAPLVEDSLERALAEVTAPPTADSMEPALPEMAGPAGGDAGISAEGRQPGIGYINPTMDQRLGALRCLGVMRSERALDLLARCATSDVAQTRTAAAFALRFYAKSVGLDTLAALAEDEEPVVAFTAGFSLWKRGTVANRILPLAQLALEMPSCRPQVVEVLAALGGPEDAAALAELSADPDPALRSKAAGGLMRMGATKAGEEQAFLDDADESVVMAALDELRGPPPAELDGALRRIANEPTPALSQAARVVLARKRPKETRDAGRFDLQVEHNYWRLKIVDRLAANPAAWALEDLAMACANSDAHTRARALLRLSERDVARARPLLAAALSDSHRWVRLHAAAQLAQCAEAAEAAALRAAAAREPDEAIALYLADALARAEGRPKPDPRPAVHPVDGKRALCWLCGFGHDVETSPADAYYTCAAPNVPPEAAQRAYRAGKIIFPRVNTVPNPWRLVLDPAWQDRFWVVMHEQLTPETLPWCDGLVFGEESMSSRTAGMWEMAWPIFCREARIDPSVVRDDIKNLNTYQARAWTHWSRCQVVEGFNILYDYVKLYYGKLRPGIQVATFLPDQGGPTPADIRWKFDVCGCYRYQGCNRFMYADIRRHKALWPERPVIWLSNGRPSAYGNKYDAPVTTNPVNARWDRPYADNVAAWLAGADSGWFSIWALNGVWLRQEDIYPGSPMLDRGIESVFATAEEATDTSRPAATDVALDAEVATPKLDAAEVATPELDVSSRDKDPVLQRIKEKKERMRQRFLLMGKYVGDCMRVFSGLPRVNARPEALALWPSRSASEFPAFHLLNAFDFLPDVNQAFQDMDLSRYRLIVLSGFDSAPVTDTTIANATRWLRDRPVLLVMRGGLSESNTNEFSTAEDHDGILRNDWPWEGEVRCGVSNYTISGPNALELAAGPAGPIRVLWRDPAFKGAVLFDLGDDGVEEWRRVLNAVARKQGVELELNGPERQETWEGAGLAAATSYSSSQTNVLAGVDLLTGEPSPAVGPGRNAAIVMRDRTSRYTASWNGVSVLCDRPIAEAVAIPGGMRLHCEGLIQAGTTSGAVTLRQADGVDVPRVSGTVRVRDWILTGNAEGQTEVAINDKGDKVLYVRCREPILLTQEKR